VTMADMSPDDRGVPEHEGEGGGIPLPEWGTITPIEAIVEYGDQDWDVTWHILDKQEEDKLTQRLQRVPPILQPKAAKTIRIAMALRAINGRPVRRGGEDEKDEFERRMEWLDTHPGPFIDAIFASYAWAELQPAVKRRDRARDPNSGGH